MTKQTNVTHSMLKKPAAAGQPTNQSSAQVPQNQKVYTVAPPEAYGSVADQLKDDLALITADSGEEEQADIMPDINDPAIQAQIKRQETFQKLMYFKQPLSKVLTIDGMDFRLKILSPVDTAEVSKVFNTLPEEEQTIYRQRLMHLVSALIDVDGVRIEEVYRGAPVSDFMKRYSEMVQWPNPLISNMLSQYDDFTLQVKEQYLPDFLKQPKTGEKG